MTEIHGSELLHDPQVGSVLMSMIDSSTWAKDLTMEDVEHLVKYLRLKRYPRGECVFSEGDPDDSMAIILKGVIEITKRDTSPEQVAKPLVLVGPGRAFGEMALIQGPPRSATARAKEEVLLLMLTRPEYDALCRENKPLALKFTINIARLMSFRLRNTSEKLVEYL